MADKTGIEWTDATWTPIRARNLASSKLKVGWYCEHVSEACANCYAERINKRLGTGLPFKPGHRANGTVELFLGEAMLTQPLRWKRPRMVFVCSMTDLFADFVPDAWIDRMFAVMALCPQHTFQVLTKRSERMRDYVSVALDRVWNAAVALDCKEHVAPDQEGSFLLPVDPTSPTWPLPNVWLGVSAEDQPNANERLPDLIATLAAIRFVSYEPALGPVNFTPWLDQLDWIIAGGESGPHARPAHPEWFRSVRDQCAAAGVAFLFKQWGEWLPGQNEEYPYGEPRRQNKVAHHQDGEWGAKHFKPTKSNYIAFTADGVARPGNQTAYPYKEIAWWAHRVGKKRAGRLLDGVEHNGFPEAALQ